MVCVERNKQERILQFEVMVMDVLALLCLRRWCEVQKRGNSLNCVRAPRKVDAPLSRGVL